jgi:hypothetical protein
MALQILINELARYGNLLGPCPIVPGQYYLKGYTMDETVSPLTRMMAEGAKYLSIISLTDENSGKPEQIASFHSLFHSNRSNWK